jgi:hypothetical protein
MNQPPKNLDPSYETPSIALSIEQVVSGDKIRETKQFVTEVSMQAASIGSLYDLDAPKQGKSETSKIIHGIHHSLIEHYGRMGDLFDVSRCSIDRIVASATDHDDERPEFIERHMRASMRKSDIQRVERQTMNHALQIRDAMGEDEMLLNQNFQFLWNQLPADGAVAKEKKVDIPGAMEIAKRMKQWRPTSDERRVVTGAMYLAMQYMFSDEYNREVAYRHTADIIDSDILRASDTPDRHAGDLLIAIAEDPNNMDRLKRIGRDMRIDTRDPSSDGDFIYVCARWFHEAEPKYARQDEMMRVAIDRFNMSALSVLLHEIDEERFATMFTVNTPGTISGREKIEKARIKYAEQLIESMEYQSSFIDPINTLYCQETQTCIDALKTPLAIMKTSLATCLERQEGTSGTSGDRSDAPDYETAISDLRSLQQGYETSSSKQLKKFDPSLAFTRSVFDGVRDQAGVMIIDGQRSIDNAKKIVGFLASLDIQLRDRDGEAVWADFMSAVELEAEIFSNLTDAHNLPDAILGSHSAWLTSNYDIILKHRDILPKNIVDIAESYHSFLQPKPESELDASDSTPPIELFGSTKKLDVQVFPPGIGLAEIRNLHAREISAVNDVHWERIETLVQLRDELPHLDCTTNLYRSKPGSLASSLPYYVLEIQHSDKTIVIADNPKYGNATYVLEEDAELGKWQEILALPKRDARYLGAAALVHVESKGIDYHRQRLFNKIVNLLS